MSERTFVISKETSDTMNKNFHHCPVCRKEFKQRDEIILCPIQKASAECGKSYVTVLSIPVHVKCYYVEE